VRAPSRDTLVALASIGVWVPGLTHLVAARPPAAAETRNGTAVVPIGLWAKP